MTKSEKLEQRIQPKIEKFFHGVSRTVHSSTIFVAQMIDEELRRQRKADTKRMIAVLENLKIELLPADFGFGYVTVNGKKRLMDNGETHLLNELAKETNKRIDRKIKAIREAHAK